MRDTDRRAGSRKATIYSATGDILGRLELGAYDAFNHYFDIRVAGAFLVLVGDHPNAWEGKWVAEVRETTSGN